MSRKPDPLTDFVQRGMAAQKAVDKATLEQISELSLLMARAGEAAINFRRAIEKASLSNEARAKLWRDWIDSLPKLHD